MPIILTLTGRRSIWLYREVLFTNVNIKGETIFMENNLFNIGGRLTVASRGNDVAMY